MTPADLGVSATGAVPLVADRIRYRHRGGGFELGPLDTEVRPGRITAVVGPSGCGKTTLTHLMAGLLTPDSGTVRAGGEVSGGKLQRVCLARALAQRPRYLLADEVTAHLDPETTDLVTGLLRRRAEGGLGVLVVTHDLALARDRSDDVVDLRARPAPPTGLTGRTRPEVTTVGDAPGWTGGSGRGGRR